MKGITDQQQAPVRVEIGNVYSIGGIVTCVVDTIDRSSTRGYNGMMVALEVDIKDCQGAFWWRPFEQRTGDPGKMVIILPMPAFVELAMESGYMVAS